MSDDLKNPWRKVTIPADDGAYQTNLYKADGGHYFRIPESIWSSLLHPTPLDSQNRYGLGVGHTYSGWPRHVRSPFTPSPRAALF